MKGGGFSVNRKKPMFFENGITRCYFWRKTGKPKKPEKTGKKREKRRKIGILLKSNHTVSRSFARA